MVLSGAMFSFDKLNRNIGSIDKVPVIAELMPTRWTYEALMVSQFKDNRYDTFSDSVTGKTIYEIKKDLSIANFYSIKLIPGLINAVKNISMPPGNAGNEGSGGLALIRNELVKLEERYPAIQEFDRFNDLVPGKFDRQVSDKLLLYLRSVGNTFSQFSNRFTDEWDSFYYY